AHVEWRGGRRFRRAADRAADGLESFGTPYAGGRWYLHDSVEQSEGRNDLVLNTHVLALIALIAGGRGAAPGLRALESVLAARAPCSGTRPRRWGPRHGRRACATRAGAATSAPSFAGAPVQRCSCPRCCAARAATALRGARPRPRAGPALPRPLAGRGTRTGS